MPFRLHPSCQSLAPTRSSRYGTRRLGAVLAAFVLTGALTFTGVAKADATKPMSPERVAEITCGHLGVECARATSSKKRAGRRARDARRKGAAARTPATRR